MQRSERLGCEGRCAFQTLCRYFISKRAQTENFMKDAMAKALNVDSKRTPMLKCVRPAGGGMALRRPQTSLKGIGQEPHPFACHSHRNAVVHSTPPPKELWAMVREHKTRSAQSAERNVARQWPIRP